MGRTPWDLTLICFSSMHRAGHILWDRSILKGVPRGGQLDAFDHALRDVYVQCDAEVGRLVDQAGPDAAVMVFSLHGMGANNDRTCLLPEMLVRILRDRNSDGVPVQGKRISDQLRGWVPEGWRAWVKENLPPALQDRLTVHWRGPREAWSRTRAFAVFCDLDGFVRINLRGRERDGRVAAQEYDSLCDRIVDGLGTFRDADTGEPLVRCVDRGSEIYGPGPMRHLLPDLVVRWADSPAVAHRRIVSDRYGWMPWPSPGRHPAGRSGNHRRAGFLLAGGGPFESGTLPASAGIMDLAPTAYQALGLDPPPSCQGRSLLARAS